MMCNPRGCRGGDDGLGVSAQRELGAVLIPPFLNAGIQRALVNDANSSSDGEKFNAVFFFQGSSQGATFLTASRKGFAWVSWEPICICNPFR